jgi:hypothetical protein
VKNENIIKEDVATHSVSPHGSSNVGSTYICCTHITSQWHRINLWVSISVTRSLIQISQRDLAFSIGVVISVTVLGIGIAVLNGGGLGGIAASEFTLIQAGDTEN